MLCYIDGSKMAGNNCSSKNQLFLKISTSYGQVFHFHTNQSQIYILFLNQLFIQLSHNQTNTSPALNQPRARNQTTKDSHLAQSPQTLFRLTNLKLFSCRALLCLTFSIENTIIKCQAILSSFFPPCDQTWCLPMHSCRHGVLPPLENYK